MTTSGVTSFNPAAVEIITAAYQMMGVINEDEVPTAGQFKVGLYALNSLTKEWEATGIHVWTEQEAIIFLQQYQRRYLIGGTTTDRVCDANQWTFTTLAAAAAQGANTLIVASGTGVTIGDNFGVVLNTGAAYWSTVSNLVGTTVTIAGALPAPASAQACVFDYPTAAQLIRPLRVPFARRLQYAPTPLPGAMAAPDWGGIITPLSPMMSRREFFDLPQPTNPGLVTQCFYDPARDQGEMWVWNVSNSANWGLRFTAYRPIQDWTTPATTGDLPQEWNNALNWNLARELGPRYSIPAERWDRIQLMAKDKLELVQGWDREPESVYFGRSSPQNRG
jgi:hypothetical protein